MSYRVKLVALPEKGNTPSSSVGHWAIASSAEIVASSAECCHCQMALATGIANRLDAGRTQARMGFGVPMGVTFRSSILRCGVHGASQASQQSLSRRAEYTIVGYPGGDWRYGRLVKA